MDRGRGWRVVFVVCAAIALLAPSVVVAQATSCDPELRPAAGDRYGYRLRGKRCEGVYAREVALSTLLVASLTSSFQEFDPAGVGRITLGWSARASGAVHLRAHSLRRRLHYRMDSQVPAPAVTWEWPTDLLAALNLSAAELGIVAWVDIAGADGQQRVYLPVRVGDDNEPAAARVIQLLLVPGRELREVFVHVAATAGGPPILDGKPMGYGYYPADRAIRIQLPTPTAAGLYRLEVGAELMAGGALSTSLLFYHSDEQ